MCVYSMIADDWTDRNKYRWPTYPLIPPFYPAVPQPIFPNPYEEQKATKRELDELRKELRELKKLLKAAAEYDASTGQPDCEQEEKIALIRRLAELTGVDMEDCLPKPPVDVSSPTVWETEVTTISEAVQPTIGTAFSDNVSWETGSDKFDVGSRKS